jgi:hypothetical protein
MSCITDLENRKQGQGTRDEGQVKIFSQNRQFAKDLI